MVLGVGVVNAWVVRTEARAASHAGLMAPTSRLERRNDFGHEPF